MSSSPEAKRKWRDKNRDKVRADDRAWRRANPEKAKEMSLKNRNRRRVTGGLYAMRIVGALVLLGMLKNLRNEWVKCTDCDDRAYCYDHRDYNKPRDVEPVCGKCNYKRGPAIPKKKTLP